MAEKSPELVTREEKIAQAKELYARGYRNYVVGDFNEAAEDLSRSCELNAELFGDESEEVSCVYVRHRYFHRFSLLTESILKSIVSHLNLGCHSELILWQNVN